MRTSRVYSNYFFEELYNNIIQQYIVLGHNKVQ